MRWDELREGEEVWSQDEFHPHAAGAWKRVEEVFRTEAFIWKLRVAGQEIKTTDEHPFWVAGKAWVPAKELQPGDCLRGHDGERYPVEAIAPTDEFVRVYNARIAEYHTYFVQAPGGGVWIWAHNACGPYGKLKTLAGHARNHLNQVAAFSARKVAGGIAYLKGVAHHLTHATHKAFHRSLRAFWRPYQAGGALHGKFPTNAQYAVALRTALREAGVHGMELGKLLGKAAAERRAAGFLPHLPVPRIPG